MKHISIAIPAHNEENSIKRNLSSIVSSNFRGKKYEIVVCVSACTDKTREKILEFKKENKKINIKIVEEKKIGKVLAYKKLDKSIKNEIIVFLDSDCGSKSDAIHKIYSKLNKAKSDIQIVSGNAVDPRYTDKKVAPKSLIEAFNRSFWQHPPRKIINGQFFAVRKGVVQTIPDKIKLDDLYLTIVYWNRFLKDNSAQIIQGSPQVMYEVVRYQKNIHAGKTQISDFLKDQIKDFEKITAKIYDQFEIKLSDKKRYYPNISYLQLILIKSLIYAGLLWAKVSQPTWSQTKSSKEIASV